MSNIPATLKVGLVRFSVGEHVESVLLISSTTVRKVSHGILRSILNGNPFLGN